MKNAKSSVSRRGFLKSASLFGGIMFLPSCATSRVKGANDKFNVALIGVGGIGIQAIGNLTKTDDAQIVAGCDVDDVRAAPRYKTLAEKIKRDVPRFKDYRVLLDKMDKDIDGVIISTADHMHYPIAAWSMARGKHTFCQKPLARTIWECREMKRLANKYGVCTQMGNQGHSSEGWRTIREWYEAGILGKVEEIFTWTTRPARFWKQGIDVTRPTQSEKIPDTLDYNLWLGVAPQQPYSSKFIPHDWRGVKDFGCGAIGDMACHFMDVPYSAFDLGYPSKVSAQTEPQNDYSWPYASTIEYEFDNPRGKNGKIYYHWFDGYRKPKHIRSIPQSFIDAKQNGDRTVIVCEKETIVANEYGNFFMIYPRERMIELKKSNALPAPTIERSVSPMNAHLEFVKMIKAGKSPNANFNYAAPFTEMALLGLVAMTQNGKPITFDPVSMTCPGNPDATRHISSLYEYRPGFIS